MKVIKHYCDWPDCGKEFDKSNMPPWYPDYCPEHMIEHGKRMKESGFGSYTVGVDPASAAPKQWYSTSTDTATDLTK